MSKRRLPNALYRTRKRLSYCPIILSVGLECGAVRLLRFSISESPLSTHIAHSVQAYLDFGNGMSVGPSFAENWVTAVASRIAAVQPKIMTAP